MRYLIVKTGDTELLRDSHLEGISDGEVFRSGVLLSRLLPRDNEVYWYGVPKKLRALFPPRQNLRFVDSFDEVEEPDEVFYLERTEVAIPKKWETKTRGFYLDGHCWRTVPRFPELEDVISSGQGSSRYSHPHWLYKLCGMTWRGEPYWSYLRVQVGETRKTPLVGLNPRVGIKWPQKGWPMERWWGLSKKLNALGCKVTWQPGGDMQSYVDWIYNLDLLISVDTLGLHIALGGGVPVIGLFGPTSPEEIPKWGVGFWLWERGGKMTHSVDRVFDATRRYLRAIRSGHIKGHPGTSLLNDMFKKTNKYPGSWTRFNRLV
jgi:heptosyltransferase-2